MRLPDLLRDRLVWYLCAGLLLFVAEAWVGRDNDRAINITLPLVEKLVAQWQAQAKRPPTPQEIYMLIEGHIREEILMREAIALGLDVDDIIIRRRLAQKMEFTMGEAATASQADEDTLNLYYEAHSERYVRPAELSFRHIFLSDDPALAEDILLALSGTPEAWRSYGKPFMLQREYLDRSEQEVAELFGNEFAQSVFNRDPVQWLGPVKSAYGWHLVQIISRREMEQISFAESLPQLAKDWMRDQEKAAQDAAWQSLRDSYDIIYEQPEE